MRRRVWKKYAGPSSDQLEADIYEPWLQPKTWEADMASHDHDHDHPHDHDHDHDHHHGSPRAAEGSRQRPGGSPRGLEQALRELLIEKGVLTAQEINAQVDFMDTRSPALGAKVVARAWSDPQFKKRLLKDTRGALEEMDIDIGTLADFRTVENTPKTHNVIVCTLCSCYPKLLLGIPPAWYKSMAYRRRAVVDPRGVLAEFGVEVPESVEVRVHNSTADLRYIVLPMRPEGTEAGARRSSRPSSPAIA